MFRLTIRDVLWLTVVVGVIMVWWLDRRTFRGQLREVREALQYEREVSGVLGLENARLHRLEARLSELENGKLLEGSEGFPGGAGFSGFNSERTGN